MSRYIDADALIAELQKDEERFDKEAEDCRKNSRNYTDCYMQAMSSRADGIRDAIVEVYDAPTIEPKRGEWIEKIVDDVKITVCSNCDKEPTFTHYYGSCGNYSLSDYCPNCGCAMTKVTKESE